MTQSEPLVPGTIIASILVVVSFVFLISTVVAGLYGLYRLLSWILA